jgi:hypothetical protein
MRSPIRKNATKYIDRRIGALLYSFTKRFSLKPSEWVKRERF